MEYSELIFLRKYHLTVDVSNNKLTASIDPERCKRDLVNKHDGLEVGFTLHSDQQTDNSLLQHYTDFPRFLMQHYSLKLSFIR